MIVHTYHRRPTPRTRHGAAIMEFAVCLPILALLVFGTIESASRIFLKQTLSVTAYEAAREAIRTTGTSGSATTRATAILSSRKVKDAVVSFNPTDTADASRGSTITVTVTAPTATNSPMLKSFIKNKTLSASVVMVKE